MFAKCSRNVRNASRVNLAKRSRNVRVMSRRMVLRLGVRTLNISRSCEITVSSPYLGIFDRIFVSSTVSSYIRPYLLLPIGQRPYIFDRIFVASTVSSPSDRTVSVSSPYLRIFRRYTARPCSSALRILFSQTPDLTEPFGCTRYGYGNRSGVVMESSIMVFKSPC